MLSCGDAKRFKVKTGKIVPAVLGVHSVSIRLLLENLLNHFAKSNLLRPWQAVPGKTVFRKHEKNRIDRNVIKSVKKVLDKQYSCV